MGVQQCGLAGQPAFRRLTPGRRRAHPVVPRDLGLGSQGDGGEGLVLRGHHHHRPVGQHVRQGDGVPDHHEPVPAADLAAGAPHPPVPVPVLDSGQVVQVQPARPAAGDVPEGRVPVHENLPPVVGLVDVQHHAPHGGGHVPHGASLLQVVQNLLQGGRRPGQLPPLVDRHLLGGVAHQDEVHALLVQVRVGLGGPGVEARRRCYHHGCPREGAGLPG